MSRVWLKISLIVFSFFVGLLIFKSSNPRFMAARNPAAIRQVYDFSHLSGSALEIAVKERLVAGIEIHKNDQGFGLSFGHFAFTDSDGQKVLGCQQFKKVILKFEAEGWAVSGSKSVLEVEGPCEFSTDLAQIHPLMIPMARILVEKPGDGDFNYQEAQALSLRFVNIPDEWPRKWVLVGIRVEGNGQNIMVDRNEVSQVLGHPLIISF